MASCEAGRGRQARTLGDAQQDRGHPQRFLQTAHNALQSLRRSGKTWEYLAAPERHKNGSWHLHLLQRGDFIPKYELSSRAESAGMGKVTWIQAVKGPDHVASYLVKYMSKSDPDMPSGTRRFSTSRKFWPGGRQACELEAFGKSDGSWRSVLLGSSGISAEDGTKLWLGA